MTEAAEPALGLVSIFWRLGLALLLVLANAFFVAAEFALVGARRTRIDALAQVGNRRAKLASAAIKRLDHYISATQLGITLASLGLGWVGESTIASLIVGLFQTVPGPWDVIGTHIVAGTIAFAFITFLHIVLGELAPKSLALLYPEATSLWTAAPLIVFSKLLTPFIVLLNGTANLLLRSVGLRAPTEKERVHRPEEIEILLTQTYEHGLLREEPVEMIRGVFHLSETVASDVMTPRTEVVALNVDTPLEKAVEFILDMGHSRYPVYEDTIDHVIGVVLARDVWRAQRAGATTLRQIVREVPFVPDTKPLEQLLRDMREEQTHIAIVIDEFGGTAGIVTIEDIVEEIVGEIEDETDEAAPEMVEVGNGRLELRGRVSIAELNGRYSLGLPDEDYTTVGGFVLGRLGRVAKVGDEITMPEGILKVLSMKGRRVDRLELTLRHEPRSVPVE
ncbi:MAG: hemolysin family protein [Gemmatimonadetes bacterium]|nr:hemolysin family protein [Gemmatimonadota bacterium]